MATTSSAVRRSAGYWRAAPGLLSTLPRQAGGDSVEAVLRRLPSHGWTAGWVGRRDRALLALGRLAGVPFSDLARLTVADVDVADGMATIRTADGIRTLTTTEDCLTCGPCALARWVHALDLAALYDDGRVVASVIARAAPLTAHSPHVCQGSSPVTDRTRSLPVFPASDRRPLTPASAGLPAADLEARLHLLMTGEV
jgi:hypothetical protein